MRIRNFRHTLHILKFVPGSDHSSILSLSFIIFVNYIYLNVLLALLIKNDSQVLGQESCHRIGSFDKCKKIGKKIYTKKSEFFWATRWSSHNDKNFFDEVIFLDTPITSFRNISKIWKITYICDFVSIFQWLFSYCSSKCLTFKKIKKGQ